jgi:hypothetical protein
MPIPAAELRGIQNNKLQELTEIISKNDYDQKNKLDSISASLESLNTERERMNNFKLELYNIKAIAAFGSSFLLPLITYIEELSNYKIIHSAIYAIKAVFNWMPK